MTRDQASSFIDSRSWSALTPALDTRTSTGPSSSSTRAKAASTSSLEVTSQRTDRNPSTGSPRWVTATRSPSAAKASGDGQADAAVAPGDQTTASLGRTMRRSVTPPWRGSRRRRGPSRRWSPGTSRTAGPRRPGPRVSASVTLQPSGARSSHTSSKREKPGIDLAAMVLIGPAATRLTRMRSGPRSRARYRERSTPARPWPRPSSRNRARPRWRRSRDRRPTLRRRPAAGGGRPAASTLRE